MKVLISIQIIYLKAMCWLLPVLFHISAHSQVTFERNRQENGETNAFLWESRVLQTSNFKLFSAIQFRSERGTSLAFPAIRSQLKTLSSSKMLDVGRS